MRVGLYFDMRNPPAWRRPWTDLYQRTLEIIEEAERRGASSVWLSEHHFFEDGYLPQPLTMAAAVAARTGRVRIGTAVYLALLRRPVQLAEEAAIVDLVSDGRLDLGLGVGYRVPEFEAYGADIANRYQDFEALVPELRRLWDGVVTPPPAQSPLPVWGGFQGPRGARMSGRLGIGLLVSDGRLYPPYLEGLEEGGHGSGAARMKGAVNMLVAEDPEAVWPAVKEHISYQWNSYRRYQVEGTDSEPLPVVDPERWRQPRSDGRPPRFPVLTPPDAAAHVRAVVGDAPVEEIFVWASAGGMPDELVERHVELVCDELVPLLAD
jgi:alkanesulfonate monooxygenase SsuD/methylene tetrahydromethanopterin reductase-like flavin-dependent oxidoreductase (luciferase family)